MKYLSATAALVGFLVAAPTLALAQQEGLVNVAVENNTVQVPIAVAAQVCGIDLDVIAEEYKGTDEVVCNIDQETAAEHNIRGQHGGGEQAGDNGRQEGLVNVRVANNTVQVPVGVAAQVCGVDADVIAREFKGTDKAVCTIDQETAAEHGISA